MKGTQSMAFLSDCAAHEAEIAQITRTAFEKRFGTGAEEVAIIAGLRRAGDVVVELAAQEAGEIVAHAMFSRVAVDPPLCRVAALGPVAVRIDRQRAGLGDSLIRAGLAACRDKGCDAAIVLGDTDYYSRFGFSVELARGIGCAFAGPHFQALEFRPGALRGVTALAYAPAFQSPGL